MALTFCKLLDQIRIITLFPKFHDHEKSTECLQYIEQHGIIVYEKTAFVSLEILNEYIHTLYFGESWTKNGKYKYKTIACKSFKQLEQKNHQCLQIIAYISKNNTNLMKLKNYIRGIIGIKNHSIHINDTHQETIRIARTAFHMPSLQYLQHYKELSVDTEILFNKVLDDYHTLSYEEQDEIAIDGSFLLEVFGKRKIRDIDAIFINEETSKKIKNMDFHNNEFKKYINPEIISIDNLIMHPDNYIYYMGIKCIHPNWIKAFKQVRNETKDQEDVKLLSV